MEPTLEQEFIARVLIHQTAVLGGYYAKEYLDKHSSSIGANLPEFILMEQAEHYSNRLLQKALCEGTFCELYEKAWDTVKDRIPEHLNALGNTLNL